jgi:uncharacterized membrane protein
VPFLFFFPGYALVAALLPRRKKGLTIDTIALSLTLSVIVTPLIGLLLNYTRWGIQLQPVLFSVAAFVFLCSLVAWWRIRRPGAEAAPQEERQTSLSLLGRGARDWAFSIAAAISLLGAVAAVAYFAAAQKSPEEFTSFYFVPANPASTGIPAPSGGDGPAQVTVGIRNHEGTAVSYRVDVLVDGQKKAQLGPVSLVNEQEWSGQAEFQPVSGLRQKIEMVLYKDGSATPYLKPIYFWVDAGG